MVWYWFVYTGCFGSVFDCWFDCWVIVLLFCGLTAAFGLWGNGMIGLIGLRCGGNLVW